MEDYERTNTREWDHNYVEQIQPPSRQTQWQVIAPADRVRPPRAPQHTSATTRQNTDHSQHQTEARIRAPPRLIDDSDNEGEGQWRTRQHHRDQVRIPESLIRQERENVSKYYEAIARQHGAFVAALHRHGTTDMRSNTENRTFGIWGKEEAVATTKKAIEAWIEETTGPQKARRAATFAKIVSLTPKQREREQKRWEREVTRQRYRQHPPPDMVFGAIGTFHWPVQEFRPEEILGTSLEAFDPIRMDCSCYVVFAVEMKVFRILGKADDVKVALARIRMACFQIAARQMIATRTYLLYYPEGSSLAESIRFERYEPPAILSPRDACTTEPGHMPCSHSLGQDDESVLKAVEQTVKAKELAYNMLLQTLRKLHFYRGHIKMRIRLGTFLATQFRAAKEGEYMLEDYQSMITESQFIGRVTQEIGDRRAEQALLHTLLKSNGLFTPHDNMIDHLSEVKPDYITIFTFADQAGDVRLFINWQETQNRESKSPEFDQKVIRWTRLDRDTGAPAAIFDLSLTNPVSSLTWQFELSAAQTIEEPRLPPHLIRFAEDLRIDAAAAHKQRPDHLFVKYNPYMNLKCLQQRINYNYRIALGNSDYTLELSHFQDRPFSDRKSTASHDSVATIYESRWSINVFREEWDTQFRSNERLAIGSRADWSDDVGAWFPEDLVASPRASASDMKNLQAEQDAVDIGWTQLMDKLAKIEDLVRSAASSEEEDLLGGMTVG